ncbi:SSI family serine proteinase inhibitor [Streptomyces zhihengii]
MRYIARGLALAGISLGLAVAPGTGSAGAAPQEARSLYAPSALVLTVTAGDDALSGTVLRAVTLGCAPRRAAPTRPPRRLRRTPRRAGRFDAGTTTAPGVSCTRQWDPVTVTADGVFDGKRVSYTHVFGNTCLQGASTGVVFDF